MNAETATGAQRLLLIRSEPCCRKCREARAVLAAAVATDPAGIVLEELTVAQAEVAGFGVVLTPTVLLNGQVLCAGIVPRLEGLLKITRLNGTPRPS